MKKSFLLMSFVAMVFGFSSVSFAQDCTVQKGHSIWNIAKEYKIPYSLMMELNKHLHNPNLIFPKDKIEFPDNSEHGTGTSTNNHSANDDIEHGTDQVEQIQTTTQAEQVLKLVNAERSKAGLQELKMSEQLQSIAYLKSKDMADNNYFDHNSKQYGTPFEMLQRYGVHYKSAGENIAAGQKTAEQVMQSWLNSSGHRANILNKNFTTIGIGYVEGGSYGTYWTQEFIQE